MVLVKAISRHSCGLGRRSAALAPGSASEAALQGAAAAALVADVESVELLVIDEISTCGAAGWKW